jgi:phosphoadenosine phosphosulfate reductase
MKYNDEINLEQIKEKFGAAGEKPFFAGNDPEKIIKGALDYFGIENIALSSSFGAEDQVLADMLLKCDKRAKIFTIDTGRLPKETLETMEATRKRYNIEIEILRPDAQEVDEMTKKYGENLFYESSDKRKLCCEIRKINPLRKKLRTLKAWICGLRKEQSPERADIQVMEWDVFFAIFKINPLRDWTERELWSYIKENNVPYNPLHDCGYPSIGCEPCTRAVRPGENIRSGRWWWEKSKKKECGLHFKGEKK